MMTITTMKPKVNYCCWCGRNIEGKPYRPTAQAHRFTGEDLVFCNHDEYSAYVKAERESHDLNGGFDCPANA